MDFNMNFDLTKLSALCNTIEQMSATTEDKGEKDFVIRLTHDDSRMLVRALLMVEEQQKKINKVVDEFKRTVNA